jgi:hypothetical protein
LHFQVLREHRAFQSAYLGQGGLLGRPGGEFLVIFCVLDGISARACLFFALAFTHVGSVLL